MKVEGADIGEAALRLVAQDLMAPLCLMRQLSFQLDGDAKLCGSTKAMQVTSELRQTVEQTFQMLDKLRLLGVEDAKGLSLEPIPISGLCHDIGEELKPLTREERCHLHFALPHRDVVVTANYAALKSIMSGFLTDATHYLAPLSDGEKVADLTLRVVQHGDGQVSFLVRDNGPAINLKRSIANLATSQVATVDGRPLASGLNLLLADSALRAMNGRLLVHNHRQGGATIETRLMQSRQLTLL